MPSGGVGIGTNNPGDYKLNVQGNQYIKGSLKIDGNLEVNNNLLLKGETTSLLGIGDTFFEGNIAGNREWMKRGMRVFWDSDNLFIGLKDEGRNRKDAVIAWGDDPEDDLRFINVQSGGSVQGNELIRVKANGNVGIGTNDPQAKLHIKQTANPSGIRLDEFNTDRYFSIAYEGQGNIRFYHKDGSGQWMSPEGKWNLNSDVSLKKNIFSIHDILDRVIQLNPVNFVWKDSEISDIGFIAQEVEEIFPEFVSSVNIKKGSLKGLPYTSFAVLAIAAIKEIKSKYDREIKILQEQISKMSR